MIRSVSENARDGKFSVFVRLCATITALSVGTFIIDFGPIFGALIVVHTSFQHLFLPCRLPPYVGFHSVYHSCERKQN